MIPNYFNFVQIRGRALASPETTKHGDLLAAKLLVIITGNMVRDGVVCDKIQTIPIPALGAHAAQAERLVVAGAHLEITGRLRQHHCRGAVAAPKVYGSSGEKKLCECRPTARCS